MPKSTKKPLSNGAEAVEANYSTKIAACAREDECQLEAIASQCLAELTRILNFAEYERLHSLMLKESWWRDHLCLSWDFHTFAGSDQVCQFLRNSKDRSARIKRICLDGVPTISFLDADCTIECLKSVVIIETDIGRGRGILRQVQDADEDHRWKICSLFTTLNQLNSHPENLPNQLSRFGDGPCLSQSHDQGIRAKVGQKMSKDPDVIIVGGGHCGLITAARLRALGVSTLVVDRHRYVGDNWRTRYTELRLHDPAWVAALPYLPFPAGWPEYASKDQVADFLVHYAESMRLNVWMNSMITSTSWCPVAKRWSVNLQNLDKEEIVTFHPKHIIQATGLAGVPKIPNDIPGLEHFKGHYYHSSAYTGATDRVKGAKVIVVGAGNSAHDIARDYHDRGATVTIVQRSSSYVISLEAQKLLMSSNYREDGALLEDADLQANSLPLPLRKFVAKSQVRRAEAIDRDMLAGLTKAGFSYSRGMDDAGIAVNVVQRSGGYYIDTGCSNLIALGKIKVKSGVPISEIKDDGMIFLDGESVAADEIVFATGYGDMRDRTGEIFGEGVKQAVGPLWGVDDEGEVRGVWRRTGLERFWVAAGSFNYCRYYSRLLALQIKALELGL